MRPNLFAGTLTAIGIAGTACAEVPSVAADIPPVHSLVAIVMQGVGTPDLLVQPGASPHGYSMRPSEAEALERADLVFWVGEGLEPWLEGPLEALASDAQVVELMAVEGTTELDVREGATFEKHSHGDDEHHDDDGHDDHDDHDDGHEDDTQAEGHDAAHDDHHDHGGHDPHAWLDPQNARVWLDVIAAELSELDTENAAAYRANAEAGKAQLDAVITEISATLEPVRGRPFVVFHDAYQYFENRFDFPAAGSIRVGDSSDPSPARIEEIHDKVQELGITCAFSEPQFNPNMINTVFRGSAAEVGVLDPLGADLTPGADLYPQLLRNLGTNLADCLD